MKKRVAVWQKTKLEQSNWRQGVVSILARHKTVITVLSAFVVFASFAVKEGWDEYVKELATTVGAAQSRYLAEIKKEDDKDKLVWLVGIINSVGDICGHRTPRSILRSDWQVINEDLPEDEIMLNDLSDLYDALPYYEPLYHELESVKIEEQALARKAHVLERQHADSADPAVQEIADGMLTLSGDMGLLDDNVMVHAENIRSRNERYHKICTRITYCLFALGWALGLIANIVGIKTSGSA